MTFEGKPRWGDHGHDDAHHDAHGAATAHDSHGHDSHGKPHDAPWVMAIPLLLLAIGAVFAGGVFAHNFVDEGQKEFWGTAIFTGADNHVLHERHEIPMWVGLSPAIAWISGLLFAIFFYLLNPSIPRRMGANGGPLLSFLQHKWYFDELYHLVFVRGAALLGDLFWKVGDKKIIDGLGPDGVTGVTKASAGGLSKLHTGYLFHYALVILLSAVVFGAVVMFGQGRG
jgi:NADH-quinone oxidoreductase subunit L